MAVLNTVPGFPHVFSPTRSKQIFVCSWAKFELCLEAMPLSACCMMDDSRLSGIEKRGMALLQVSAARLKHHPTRGYGAYTFWGPASHLIDEASDG